MKLAIEIKVPRASMLFCRRMRGGKKALWHAICQDPLLAIMDIPSMVGAGNTADNAIRDYQKQFRAWAKKQTTLHDAIQALGTTEGDLLKVLREKGIKGYRCTASRCPIAKYLNSCGFDDVTIGAYVSVYSDGQGDPDIQHHLPEHVRNWITAFDKGQYPEFYL